MTKRGFEEHERFVAELYGLDQTITSGNKFYDPGDAVSRHSGPFALFADAKYTEKLSYSLKLKELQDYAERATMRGKRLILPVRFFPPSLHAPSDWVVLNAHDLAELLTYVPETP